MADQTTTTYWHSPKAVTDSTRRERSRNAKRYAEQPWRRWYNTAAWRARKSAQKAIQPLCELCLARGKVVPMWAADHHPPHDGDWYAFMHGPVRSLCESCHNGEAQRQQKGSTLGGVDADGRPTSPDHPWNAP